MRTFRIPRTVGFATRLLLVGSVSALLGTQEAQSQHASTCLASVVWHGTHYYGMVVDNVIFGRPLGEGAMPICGGTGSQRVSVVSLAGIAPTVALGVEGDSAHGYLAPGYFPQLRSHPLHQGGRSSPNATLGCTLEPIIRFSGTVLGNSYNLVVEVWKKRRPAQLRFKARTLLLVDVHTHIYGQKRNGLPYVKLGEWVSVRAQPCRIRGAHDAKMIARSVYPTK